MKDLTWNEFIEAQKKLEDYHKSHGIDLDSLKCHPDQDIFRQIDELVKRAIEKGVKLTFEGIEIKITEGYENGK